MKTLRTRRPGYNRTNPASFTRIATLVALVALIGIPLLSWSTSSLGRTSEDNRMAAPAMDSSRGGSVRADSNAEPLFRPEVFSTNIGRASSFPLIMPQATPTPAIATYEDTCTTADSEFNLGQEVCATATDTGGSASRRRITWVDPSGYVRQSAPVTTDTQNDNFTIPDDPTTTLSNGEVAQNIGKWRVQLVGRTLVTYAVFVVKDPANDTADLSVTKNAPANAQSVAAGSNGSFDIVVHNGGPDDAADVSVIDHVPANTTFVTMVQTSGQPTSNFTCTTVPDGLGNITCTIETFAADASATFSFVYTVNAGTASGTAITNTVSIASATTNEPNTADNAAEASATVAASGSGGVCTLTCADDIVTPANTTDEFNNPGAIVHFAPTTSEGTCGVVTTDHCNDCFFPLGTTTVTTSTTTGDSCSFTVTVTETGSNATISCPPNKTANANSDCEAVINLGNPVAGGDNVTVSVSRSDGKPMYDCDMNGENCVRKPVDLPFSAGITTVTWTATTHNSAGDETGNATCQQRVTVSDTTPPVITAEDSTVSADADCLAPVPDYTNQVSDNCSCASDDESQDCIGKQRITLTQSPAAGTMVGIGPHTIHLSANDGASDPGPDGIPETGDDGTGNVTEKDVTFTVVDTTAPVITCPNPITANTEPGTCSAVVDPGTATATDNCDSTPTITGTRSDGQPLNAPYPGGTTTITWRATDDANNYSECTQTITVEDHEAPTIVCPANVTQGTDPGTCSAIVNPGQPTTADNCDSSPTVTSTRSDGQAMNAPYPKGTTTITWRSTDDAGNYSECTQTVTVYDDEAPVITFNGTQTMWPPNHKYKTFTTANLVASVNDNCDGPIAVSSVVITKVTSDELENSGGDGNTLNDIVIAANCKSVQLRAERDGGSNGRVYTIFYSVRDAAGNAGTGTTKVVVPHNPGQTVVDSGPHYTVMSNCP